MSTSFYIVTAIILGIGTVALMSAYYDDDEDDDDF